MSAHYPTVRDDWKAPKGPYHQAPAEYGGEWWYVSPFNPTPWVNARKREELLEERVNPTYPEGFIDLFGPRPEQKPGMSAEEINALKRFVLPRWEQDLGFFKGVGYPEGLDYDALDEATEIYSGYGLGEPAFYEGRYGWKARFPESNLRSFECGVDGAIRLPHLVVSNHQARAYQTLGIEPNPRHPYLLGTDLSELRQPNAQTQAIHRVLQILSEAVDETLD